MLKQRLAFLRLSSTNQMNDQVVYVVKCGYPFDGSLVQGVYENVLDAIESCEQQLLSEERFLDFLDGISAGCNQIATNQKAKLEWAWYAQNRDLPQSIILAGLDRNGFECIWTIERRNVIGVRE